MLLYKTSRIFLNRFEDKFIVAYNRRDRVLNTIFDLLILYRSFKLKIERSKDIKILELDVN